MLEDPVPMTTDELRKWLIEPAPADIEPLWEVLWRRFPNYYFHWKPGFDLFIIACCRTWVGVGDQRRNLPTNLGAAYLMAHRFTEWRGLV
jgi:hypothetical protein